MRDYQYHLRLGNSAAILKAQLQLLLVLLALDIDSTGPYPRAILMFRLHLDFLRQQHPNLYQYITTNMDAFNEEEGEISLAILQNTTVGKATRSSSDKLSLHYRLQHVLRDSTEHLSANFGVGGEASSPFGVTDPNLTTTNKIVSHLQGHIRKLQTGTATHATWPSQHPGPTLPLAAKVNNIPSTLLEYPSLFSNYFWQIPENCWMQGVSNVFHIRAFHPQSLRHRLEVHYTAVHRLYYSQNNEGGYLHATFKQAEDKCAANLV